MRPVIFVFPGQAAQFVGMGRDLFENSPAARAVMERAEGTEGLRDIKHVTFDGPEELLTRTDNVQPAITVVSLMALAALREKASEGGLEINLLACAGHSLGEYAAHVAAGNLSESLAIHLVRWRGCWMNEASQPPNPKGGMMAIMGLALDKVQEIAATIGRNRIGVANINSPGQIILSGEATAVEDATSAALAAGAKRVIPLNVSGAWHSPLMLPAQARMVKLLEGEITEDSVSLATKVHVIANATSEAVDSIARLQETLGRQITTPVIWTDCVRRLFTTTGYPDLPSAVSSDELERYAPWPLVIEVGPGKVLRGLIRNLDKAIETAGVEDMASVEAAMRSLAA